ncbi:MAG: winged helix-turn-helix domain-containing protein [Mesorhizobium sp.]|nr:MAG: winged helix-turn-helix domain-containing protein [Mesorhizobium sp.]
MAELHRLWRLEMAFGTERPQLTKRKDNKRLLYIWRFRDVRCLPAMCAEVRLDYATAPSGHPLLGVLRRTTIGWKQVDKRPWRHHLTTLLLLRAGYAYVPYKLAGERDRAEQGSYYLSLRRTQGTIRMDAPDWNPWLEFFLRALQSQKQHLEKKMEREQVMLAALPESSVPILELASEHGRATVAETARVSGASRNTIKDHLKALVEQGHLTRHCSGAWTPERQARSSKYANWWKLPEPA